MTRILIVEDNRNLARMLQHNLTLEGYQPEVAVDGAQALDRLRAGPVDLLLLDLMIPPPDGLEVLRRLRGEGCETPALVLTARGESADKLRSFGLGADDYVTKPFDLLELLARISAILRRTARRDPGPSAQRAFIRLGSVEIDLGSQTVSKHGVPVHLRPKEYDLLVALARRNGAVATRTELLNEVWRYHPDIVSRTIDTHIGELRRKLEPDPARPTLILTVRKTGFRVGSIVATGAGL